DTVNRNALESALQSVGARVQGVCTNRKPLRGCSANADCDSAFGAGDGRCRRIAAFEPPLSGPMRCTDFAAIEVPLTAHGRAQAVKRLRLKARSSGRLRSDTDGLTLVCQPARQTPTPTPTI